MGTVGASRLTQVIEAHESWGRAAAVRDGRQPALDPDRSELVEFTDERRVYGTYKQDEFVGGSRVVRSYQVTKRLVDGIWVREDIAV